LQQGDRDACAGRKGPKDAHPERPVVPSGKEGHIQSYDRQSVPSFSLPALHFVGRPIVVAPRHLGRAENEAEHEAEEYRQEDTEHQALQANQLQISVGYDSAKGQRHHGSL